MKKNLISAAKDNLLVIEKENFVNKEKPFVLKKTLAGKENSKLNTNLTLKDNPDCEGIQVLKQKQSDAEIFKAARNALKPTKTTLYPQVEKSTTCAASRPQVFNRSSRFLENISFLNSKSIVDSATAMNIENLNLNKDSSQTKTNLNTDTNNLENKVCNLKQNILNNRPNLIDLKHKSPINIYLKKNTQKLNFNQTGDKLVIDKTGIAKLDSNCTPSSSDNKITLGDSSGRQSFSVNNFIRKSAIPSSWSLLKKKSKQFFETTETSLISKSPSPTNRNKQTRSISIQPAPRIAALQEILGSDKLVEKTVVPMPKKPPFLTRVTCEYEINDLSTQTPVLLPWFPVSSSNSQIAQV